MVLDGPNSRVFDTNEPLGHTILEMHGEDEYDKMDKRHGGPSDTYGL